MDDGVEQQPEQNEAAKSQEEEKKNEPVNKESFTSTATVSNFVNSFQMNYNVLSIIIVCVAVAVIVFIGLDECRMCFKKLENSHLESDDDRHLKTYWVYGKNIEGGYLNNLFSVLGRLGYKNDPNSTDWDLLWAHDYPFRVFYTRLNDLKPHQKVNHFPGCGYITNKVDLATAGLKYIPPAFKLPVDKERLLKYVRENSDVKFVQKNNDHRNIRIRDVRTIDLDKEGTFIQKYVERPLLIGGYKFDIGIYTIITSIDPLRIYIYNGDALLRFCPVQYYPFDSDILDKYVVGDDYLPTWEVPALKYYYVSLGFGMKESLNMYLRAKGKDPSVIWGQIEDAIRIVVLNKEPDILDVVKRFKSKRNFFEMMRFDFVVDENLEVFLMEANMSPNLSSAHFPPNKLLFEQVIFNLMGLIGVGERLQRNSLSVRSESEEHMQASDKNIAVFPVECNSGLCRSGCVAPSCQLCRNCISPETRTNLLQAYKEHVNRGDCKRIFPPPLNASVGLPADDFEEYSAENQLMYRWFLGKCRLDSAWCT